MKSNRIGLRVFIFCIAFLFGFSTVELFSANNDELTPNEIKQGNILKINKDFRKVEFEQSPAKLPCKKFSNQKDYQLLKEEAETMKLLTNEIKNSQDQTSTRRELKKLEKEIKSLENKKSETPSEETVEEFKERLNEAKKREQSTAHTLLYVNGCAEYNEPR